MRFIALALALLLASFSAAQGFPVYGDDGGEAKCMVFDCFKSGLPEGIESLDPNVALCLYYVDVAFTGLGDNFNFGINDSSDKFYPVDVNISQILQPGRAILAFIVPRDMVAKALVVKTGSDTFFSVDWDPVIKYPNGIVNLRYLGIGGWSIDINQTITLDILLSNNGTAPITISPANFSMVDQWGWRYFPEDTFSSIELPSKNQIEASLAFIDLSPRSRPAILEFDHSSPSAIMIDLRGSEEAAAPQAAAGEDTASASQAATSASEPPAGIDDGQIAAQSIVAPTPAAAATSTTESVGDARAMLDTMRRGF